MRNAVLFAVLALGATSALAGLPWYDNTGGAGPNGASGNEMTAWLQTEDFILPAAGTLEDIDFWGFSTGGPAWDGSVRYWIFADNGGNPGAALNPGGDLATLGAGNVKQTVWGNTIFGPDYLFHIEPTKAIALAQGTKYHLGLHLDDVTNPNYVNRDDWYWETQNGNGTNTGIESAGGTQNNWSNNGQEHAFRLSQTPEPASFLGLLSLALLARRR